MDGEKININIKTGFSILVVIVSLVGIWYSSKYQIDNNTRDINSINTKQEKTEQTIKDFPKEVGKIIDEKLESFGNELVLKLDDRYLKKKTE